MRSFFKTTQNVPISTKLSEWLNEALPSSLLSDSVQNKQQVVFYGDSANPKTSLSYFYGDDIPHPAPICSNGLFSYGHQTQMHRLSFLYRYPYFHPVAMIHSLLFLFYMHFEMHLIAFLMVFLIHFTTADSLKIERHDSLETYLDFVHICAQFIGDIILIPYQFFNGIEFPLIQFQDTATNRYIFSQCKTMLDFSPTFWCRSYILQFCLVVWEEQLLPYKRFKIYRETLQTSDNGLIALDYWIDPQSVTQTQNAIKDSKASFGDVYKSKMYYQYSPDTYGAYEFPDGDNAPILFIFGTFAGDNMAPPVRRMASYFCVRGWRVIHFTKRGCGSPYYESLPLNTHKTFDLAGIEDSELAIRTMTEKYPNAHKLCVGFSLGGSQVQDALGIINYKQKYFIGGIKIDGSSYMPELKQFNVRQRLICRVLGAVVHSSYITSLFGENVEQKVNELQNKAECKDFDFKYITRIKSEKWGLIELAKYIWGPAAGITDDEAYLHAVGPVDIERVQVPMLVINSWNDGFQAAKLMPIGIANVNPNIIHCVTRLGAHCIRREGALFNDCWQTRVTFEFAQAVVDAHKGK